MNKRFKLLLFGATLLTLVGCQSTSSPPVPNEPEVNSDVSQDSGQQSETTSTSSEPAAADVLFGLAREAQANNRQQEAIDRYRQLISIRPDYPEAQINLGLLLFSGDQPDQAKAYFLSAIEQDSQPAIAYNHLAISARRSGDFASALEFYQQALALDPEYANAHLNLGILLDIYLQKLPQALQHYQKYQELTQQEREEVGKWIVDLKRRIARQER